MIPFQVLHTNVTADVSITVKKDLRAATDRHGIGSSYPELVLSVLGSLVEGPVIVEAVDIVNAVEALDPLRHTLQLRHIRNV